MVNLDPNHAVRVVFTRHLTRHVDASPAEVSAGSLRDVLSQAFSGREALRGYVLDDAGTIRRHIAVFVDNDHWRGSDLLEREVAAGAEVYVMQALSGG